MQCADYVLIIGDDLGVIKLEIRHEEILLALD